MREFMTRVSDYWKERRDDPERKENQLSIIVIGAVAVVVIVLLLLLLWGHSTQEKKQKEAAEKARELQEQEAQGLVATTYEEKMEEYMSQASGDELRQEYLTSTTDLGEQVKELQTTLEQVQKELTKVITEYGEGNEAQKEKLTLLEREVKTILERAREMEAGFADLSDLVQVIDREKIPMIQVQVKDFQGEIEQVRTDVSEIHEKIAALEKEDTELWEKLSGVERKLENALEKNLSLEKEMQRALDKLTEKINEKMETLSEESLSYRYEQRTNTLYLMPNQKSGAKEVQP